MRTKLAVLVLLSSLTGCIIVDHDHGDDDSPPVISCDFAGEDYCYAEFGAIASNFESVCVGLGGEVYDEDCPAGDLATCTLDDGDATSVRYYYDASVIPGGYDDCYDDYGDWDGPIP
jgi:hypothetical protein